MYALAKGLIRKPARCFVTLSPESILKHKKFETPKDYYNQLLTFKDVNERGLMNVEPFHLNRMTEKCQTSEDIDVVVEAYYNLLGHRTSFKNSDVDQLLKKAIECRHTKPIHNIIKFHRVLMYYPQPAILEEILNYYKAQELKDEVTELGIILLESKMLKLTNSVLSSLISAAGDSEDSAFVLKCYQRASKAGMSMTGDDVQRTLIENAYKAKKEQGFASSEFYDQQISKDIDISKLSDKDIIKLAAVQLPDQVAFLAHLSYLLDYSFQKSPSYILDAQDDTTKEIFDVVTQKSNSDETFKKQLIQLLDDIQAKHAEKGVDPEIRNLVVGESDSESKNSDNQN